MSQQGGDYIAPTGSRLSAPVPEGWEAQITAYERGEFSPVSPKHAATVVLLRDGAGTPPDVYLLKRAASMSFAGGFYAFPGGRVDPRDADADIAWAGPSAAQWARRFGSDEAEARALLCAAVRETFEESGVLFAGADEHSVVADTTDEGWEADRRALVSRETSLAGFLAKRSLVLRTDLLGGWSRWITPEFEPRRYDTAFFVAALPAGQRTRDVSGETESTIWMQPRQAIDDHIAGRALMLPPTVTTLREVHGFGTAEEAVASAADRPLKPIMATVRKHDDGSWHLEWEL
ncbi:NUDIX domain-containing protein [Catenulispora sp. NL8]|uniref:NUDIX domain-containing protein n=1 Tax=Catenulispora pinistramenti TaxID=2705254 RepID=A0ABS5KVL0_9ACTN|nr:NUDIX domain-containing protein [Catenulispora pinistramenti]MBS2550081.1 NUDIX domain-containing protein [Catenulispora pinistramenti]